jgi:hypothetical protein
VGCAGTGRAERTQTCAIKSTKPAIHRSAFGAFSDGHRREVVGIEVGEGGRPAKTLARHEPHEAALHIGRGWRRGIEVARSQTDRIAKETGWRSAVTWPVGVERTIAWIKGR